MTTKIPIDKSEGSHKSGGIPLRELSYYLRYFSPSSCPSQSSGLSRAFVRWTSTTRFRLTSSGRNAIYRTGKADRHRRPRLPRANSHTALVNWRANFLHHPRKTCSWIKAIEIAKKNETLFGPFSIVDMTIWMVMWTKKAGSTLKTLSHQVAAVAQPARSSQQPSLSRTVEWVLDAQSWKSWSGWVVKLEVFKWVVALSCFTCSNYLSPSLSPGAHKRNHE